MTTGQNTAEAIPASRMQMGDRVLIHRQPLLEQGLEGEAELVEYLNQIKYSEDGRLERWFVYFEGDDKADTYERWVLVPHPTPDPTIESPIDYSNPAHLLVIAAWQVSKSSVFNSINHPAKGLAAQSGLEPELPGTLAEHLRRTISEALWDITPACYCRLVDGQFHGYVPGLDLYWKGDSSRNPHSWYANRPPSWNDTLPTAGKPYEA